MEHESCRQPCHFPQEKVISPKKKGCQPQPTTRANVRIPNHRSESRSNSDPGSLNFSPVPSAGPLNPSYSLRRNTSTRRGRFFLILAQLDVKRVSYEMRWPPPESAPEAGPACPRGQWSGTRCL